MASPETRSKALDVYKEVNKITLVGALGFAAFAAFYAPELVIPALAVAAFDATQIVLINHFNKKENSPKAMKSGVVYQVA